MKNAGILNANGNIDLNQFPKNIKGTLDGEEVLVVLTGSIPS
ncbi:MULTISPECIES: hypothetical protein [unclassified Bacillus (in: firmicutes)]|nr:MULTISPECIES: hypothetical protein [unclassified Bacillus (in: firmicutes)]